MNRITSVKALRMWHWRQVEKLRESQLKFERNADLAPGNREYYKRMARLREQEANLHLSAVQVLNDSLPGTAEQDCAEADAAMSAAEDNKYNRGV